MADRKLLCGILIGILHYAFSSTSLWPVTIVDQSIIGGSNEHNDQLLVDGDTIYIGSSDVLYKIVYSGTSMSRHEIPFPPESAKCSSSNPDIDCANHIRLLMKHGTDKLLVCGTNSKKPKCVYLDKQDTTSKVDSGLSVEIADYTTRAVTLIDYEKTELYYASTTASKKGRIYKSSAGTSPIKSKDIWFKEPQIVDIMFDNDQKKHVFTFLNDKIEVLGRCKSGYHAFVSRVCTKDNNNRHDGQWTTHAKAHLRCFKQNSEGDILKYRELSSVQITNERVYGIFNPPSVWEIKSSAICAFDINSINDVFDGKDNGGKTKFRKVAVSGEVSDVIYDSDPSPYYPGQCPNGASAADLPDSFFFFAGDNPAVSQEISPMPLFVHKPGIKFSHLLALEMTEADILYLFSDDGLLNKVRISRSDNEVQLLHNINIFNDKVIKNKKIVSVSFNSTKKGIVVVTPEDVLLITVSSCDLYTDCSSCIVDPHCYWQSPEGFNFFCSEEKGKDLSQICGNAPTPPTELNAVYNEIELTLTISWSSSMENCLSCTSVVKLTESLTSNVLQITKTDQSNLVLQDVKLKPGLNYKIIVSIIKGGIESESVVYEFTTDIHPVPVQIVYNSNQTVVEWTSIPGVAHYIVNFYNINGSVMFEGKIAAETNKDSYRLPFPIDVSLYNISVSAVSSENIQSNEMFISNLDPDEWTPDFITGRLNDNTEPCITDNDMQWWQLTPLTAIICIGILAILLLSTTFMITRNSITFHGKNMLISEEDHKVTYIRKCCLFWLIENHEPEKGQTSLTSPKFVPP